MLASPDKHTKKGIKIYSMTVNSFNSSHLCCPSIWSLDSSPFLRAILVHLSHHITQYHIRNFLHRHHHVGTMNVFAQNSLWRPGDAIHIPPLSWGAIFFVLEVSPSIVTKNKIHFLCKQDTGEMRKSCGIDATKSDARTNKHEQSPHVCLLSVPNQRQQSPAGAVPLEMSSMITGRSSHLPHSYPSHRGSTQYNTSQPLLL